jgi:hypothetical protein
MTWELKHSVIANADRKSVWAWHSNVDNWVGFEGDAVESITLDGPFQTGTHITTTMSGQEPRRAIFVEVEPPGRTVIEMDLGDAVLQFAWTFEELSANQTRLSQQIILQGPGAEAYVPLMQQHFEPNIVPGMERIAEEMAKFATRR